MKKSFPIITLLLIFAAGWFAKEAYDRRGKKVSLSTAEDRSSPHEIKTQVEMEEKKNFPSDDAKKISLALDELLRDESEGRVTKMNRTLEQICPLPLTSDLLKSLRQVLASGRVEECNYLFSVLENREDKDSRALMLDMFENSPHEHVKERARFALEAAAGETFQNVAEAKKWFSTWIPDPERTKLFTANQEEDLPIPERAQLRKQATQAEKK